MSALRLIYDNAADRATIVASSTAGTLAVQNLKTDRKGEVHRSIGKAVTYTLTWPTPETVGGVGLPAVNLTNMGEVRVRAYDDADELLGDSGWLWAAQGLDMDSWDWDGELNGNAFPEGYMAKTAVWLPEQVPASKLVIDLRDDYIEAGYIDCARIVAGGYWQPTYGAAQGAQTAIVDSTAASRNDAGDLVTDMGTKHDTMTLDLSVLLAPDRARMQKLMRSNGASRPVFISAVPTNGDPVLVQDWTIYGLRQNSAMTWAANAFQSNQLVIEGW